MTQYMNYGSIGSGTTTPNVPVVNRERGQVFLATHDEQDNLLPSLRRSFISFSWGDKNIEDFNFIVTSEDRHEGNFYAPFEDLTTKNELSDGQYYWGFSFSPNELELKLSTDGVTEDLLQSFKGWFQPGITRELILAESPNKKIYARISEPPEFSLMPFEESVKVKIGEQNFTTSTTKWKGDVTLKFIMDDPFWESVRAIYNEDLNSLSKTARQELVKSIFEDGIPHKDMFNISDFENKYCFLANDQYITAIQQDENSDFSLLLTTDNRTNRPRVDLNVNETYYIYNCGTAAVKPIVHFGFTPVWDDQTETSSLYISFPPNTYISNMSNQEPYFTIEIGSHIFKLSTPGILASYNQAIKILSNDFKPNDDITELKRAFRDSISDVYVRMMTMAICELAINENWYSTLGICELNGALTSNFRKNFAICLKGMFTTNPNNNNQNTFSCAFDSFTGESTFSTYILTFDKDKIQAGPESGQILPEVLPWKTPSQNQQTTPIQVSQNAGDMVHSKYLIIDSRTLPVNGVITPNDCLKLEINTGSDTNYLYDFSIIYNYMYY